MDIALKELTKDAADIFTEYLNRRTISTCEGQFGNHFIWNDFYRTKYYQTDKFIWLLETVGNKKFTMMPLCKEEDIIEALTSVRDYFNQVLNRKLELYLADERFVEIVREHTDEYIIEESRDYFDYIYDANKLKTLSGKQYHKKKNHVNAFNKIYGERYRYKCLTDKDQEIILDFLADWKTVKIDNDEEHHLNYEFMGVQRLLRDYDALDVRMGGILIDDRLEAMAIGTYNDKLKRAYIHVEKANTLIRGLYPFINQQLLINEFPEAQTVNREDDMGLEGLRKAKLSYNPIELIKKYTIIQK